MDIGKVAGIVAEGVEKSCRHSSTKSRWRGRGREGYLLSAFFSLNFFNKFFNFFQLLPREKLDLSLPLLPPSPSRFLERGSGEIGESGRVKSDADQPDTNNGVERRAGVGGRALQ